MIIVLLIFLAFVTASQIGRNIIYAEDPAAVQELLKEIS